MPRWPRAEGCQWREGRWHGSLRCPEPVTEIFESGLGYCRRHAEAVKRNREWLLDFAEWMRERSRRTAGAPPARGSRATG